MEYINVGAQYQGDWIKDPDELRRLVENADPGLSFITSDAFHPKVPRSFDVAYLNERADFASGMLALKVIGPNPFIDRRWEVRVRIVRWIEATLK